MRIGKRDEIEKMLKEAKIFVNDFDEFVSNLTNQNIKDYRDKIKIYLK